MSQELEKQVQDLEGIKLSQKLEETVITLGGIIVPESRRCKYNSSKEEHCTRILKNKGTTQGDNNALKKTGITLGDNIVLKV